MTTKLKKVKKKRLLRNNEYYDFQEVQDNLYKLSKNNKKFNNLLEIITDKRNVLLAYRNIKRNKGSMTPGTNFKNIMKVADTEPQKLIDYVKTRLENYKPEPVKRVLISKEGNNGFRPLGIPCIEDRLIQQCIKQVLEPIAEAEAKFHPHSYGFRPNRSTHHALARVTTLANLSHLHYVVDIDIKGFFDNVNHSKLLKQLWSFGIQDKNLISIISKMLKAEIKGEGIPTKGTPQGGILSPILSNIVLNELDWWISNQWETFKLNKKGHPKSRYTTMKATNLKEMYIVRYADDFKLMCRDYKTAQKAFIAVKDWLKDRLNLDISPDKSKVINIRKKHSNFLGFKLKVVPKGDKMVVYSHVSDKAKKKIISTIKERIKDIEKSPITDIVYKYNATILGMHNYYKYATHVNRDFHDIAFLVNKNLYHSTKNIRNSTGYKSKEFELYYGKYNYYITYIANQALFPIAGIKKKDPMNFSQNICNYTIEGREKIHDKLKGISYNTLKYLMENPIETETTEYNDNRVSLYVGQKGKCSITGEPLVVGNMECHHKKPRKQGGSDKYANLTFVIKDIHKLIHATTDETVQYYLDKVKKLLNKGNLTKLNKLRKLVGNCELYIN